MCRDRRWQADRPKQYLPLKGRFLLDHTLECVLSYPSIEKAVVAVDRGAVLSFDLEAHTVDVTSRLNETELAAILDKEGYPNTLAD